MPPRFQAAVTPVERQLAPGAVLVNDADDAAVNRDLRVPGIIKPPTQPTQTRSFKFALGRGANFITVAQWAAIVPFASVFDVSHGDARTHFRIHVERIRLPCVQPKKGHDLHSSITSERKIERFSLSGL